MIFSISEKSPDNSNSFLSSSMTLAPSWYCSRSVQISICFLLSWYICVGSMFSISLSKSVWSPLKYFAVNFLSRSVSISPERPKYKLKNHCYMIVVPFRAIIRVTVNLKSKNPELEVMTTSYISTEKFNLLVLKSMHCNY